MGGLDMVAFLGLGALAIIDVRNKKIPVWFVIIFSMVLFAIRLLNGIVWGEWFCGLIVGFIILILAIVTKEKIGIGDGFVLCALGIGYRLEEMISMLGISLFLIAICAIGLLILKKANKKTELPFLPYLFIGYFLTIWIK